MDHASGGNNIDRVITADMEHRTDFRVMIFLKYLLIGGCDVIFWWTVWNIADYLHPIIMTLNPHQSYVHGYIFVVAANITYLVSTTCFKTLLGSPIESEQQLHPTSIVTITPPKPDRKPSVKARVVRCVLPFSVYLLTVGFIHIWRGHFALFYYLVEGVFTENGLNMVASRIILILLAGMTLIFNQKNNTVNLCPTHKIYKFDELEYLNDLFKMNILKVQALDTVEINDIQESNDRHDDENENEIARTVVEGEDEVIVNMNTPAVRLSHKKRSISHEKKGTLITDPFHHEFSSGLCLAMFLKKLHRTRCCLTFPRKWYCHKAPRLKHLCQPAHHVRINIDILTMISRSCGINFIENVGLLSDEHTTTPTPTAVPNDDSTRKDVANVDVENSDGRVEMFVEIFETCNIEETTPEDMSMEMVTVNHHAVTDDVDTGDHCASVTHTHEQEPRCTCGQVMVKKLSRTVTPSELDDIETQIAREYHQLRKEEPPEILQDNEIKKVGVCQKNCIHCRLSHFCAYIYLIHYEHVFLQTFGAMFWSSTWGLFDTVIEPIFTNTPQDIPWLLLIAVTSHCINHLVLFRVKETSKKLRWRTVCEFLCGLNTVLFWASSWHVLNILALLDKSHRLRIFVTLHVSVFLGLSISKLSINIAL